MFRFSVSAPVQKRRVYGVLRQDIDFALFKLKMSTAEQISIGSAAGLKHFPGNWTNHVRITAQAELTHQFSAGLFINMLLTIMTRSWLAQREDSFLRIPLRYAEDRNKVERAWHQIWFEPKISWSWDMSHYASTIAVLEIFYHGYQKCSIARWLAYLLPDPAAPGSIPSIPKFFSEEKLV